MLCAFLRKSPSDVVTANMVEPILSIAAQLTASRTHDHEGINIFIAVFEEIPMCVELWQSRLHSNILVQG